MSLRRSTYPRRTGPVHPVRMMRTWCGEAMLVIVTPGGAAAPGIKPENLVQAIQDAMWQPAYH